MDVELAFAAIQQQRDAEASYAELVARAQRSGAPRASGHTWHARSEPLDLVKRARWLLHIAPSGTSARPIDRANAGAAGS